MVNMSKTALFSAYVCKRNHISESQEDIELWKCVKLMSLPQPPHR